MFQRPLDFRLIVRRRCEARERFRQRAAVTGARRPRSRAGVRRGVEAIVGPEIDQTGEDIGEASLWVDAVQFGCFDERGEGGPIFGPVIVSREESILARQSNLAVILPISGRMS